MTKAQPGQVPPGDETGLYYIIVANLPWQCSWQRLKDFARDQQPDGSCLNVDHAMVYPGSTNGWVRVKGKEDFHKALAHLDGGVFEHRALMADGRNETSPVHLPDISCSRTVPSPRMNRHDSVASTTTSFRQQTDTSCSEYPSQDYYRPTSSFSPVTTNFQTYSAVYESAQYAVQQPAGYLAPVSTAGSVTYAGNMAPETPVYIPPPVYSYVGPLQYGETPAAPLASDPAQFNPLQTVKTEARKIIITQLPHTIKTSELDELLTRCLEKLMRRGKIPSNALVVQQPEIARHSDGKPKGHAFVVFDDHHIAKCVVNALDKYKFQGRPLSARLAKEGVEAASRSSKTSNDMRTGESMGRRASLTSTSMRSSTRGSSKLADRRPASLDPDVVRLADLEIREEADLEDNAAEKQTKEGSSRHRAKTDEHAKSSRSTWKNAPAVVDGSSSICTVRKHRS